MNNYRWIWRYVKLYKDKVRNATILLAINSSLIFVAPKISQFLVDRVIMNGEHNYLVPALLLLLAVTVFRLYLRYNYQLMYEGVGQDVWYDLRNEMFAKLHDLDFDYFNHTRVGNILALFTGDSDAIRHFVSWVGYNGIEAVIWFVAAIIIMVTMNWQLTLALVLVTPFIFIITQQMSKVSRPKFFDIRNSFASLNAMVEENIAGNRVVRAFAREDFEIEKFNKHNEDYCQKNIASAKVSSTYQPILEFLATSLTVITLLVGGYMVIKGNMTVGELVAFNNCLWMLNMPMRNSGWLINDTQRFHASCVKIQDYLWRVPKIPKVETEEKLELAGSIEFENVSFHFPDDPDTPILKNINLKVEAGQTLGILGETGSGKSTLANLIGRYFDPTEGVVKVDGKNVKEYPVTALRDNIAMVMQDVFLFSESIRDNLSYSSSFVSEEQVRRMARAADADEFIKRMPEGYDTVVGPRGVGLSGGQQQRISLARALIKDPAILILDDTTSAVDMETEAKIQEALSKLEKEQTTVIIAHRISSVREADLIILLEKGEIIERGTHEELLEQKGAYYDLYNKQLGIERGD